jgi:hypothetical protein
MFFGQLKCLLTTWARQSNALIGGLKRVSCRLLVVGALALLIGLR